MFRARLDDPNGNPASTARIDVGDYDAWKPLFDKDLPDARQAAKSHRIFRSAGEPRRGVFLLVPGRKRDG